MFSQQHELQTQANPEFEMHREALQRERRTTLLYGYGMLVSGLVLLVTSAAWIFCCSGSILKVPCQLSKKVGKVRYMEYLYRTLYPTVKKTLQGQPYSGHASRQSLEISSRLSLSDAQPSYNQAMERFPIH